ncbi:hypothetical protein E4U61_008035, partial [Claviceps capensis]
MATSKSEGDTETCNRSSGNFFHGTAPNNNRNNDDNANADLTTNTPPRNLSKDHQTWRRIVRNFAPSWFAVNMGTGIVSATLHNLPYNGPWLQCISYIFFGLNVLLFVTFLGLSIARYTMYPRLWGAMIAHPGQSLFLGCFPMGFA